MQTKYFLFLILPVILFGCQNNISGGNLSTEAVVFRTETPTFVVATPTTSEHSSEWDLWSNSPHADTYADQSSNTYCAKCHSPSNWNVDSSAEKAITVSKGEWQDIPCETCHETNGEEVSSSVAWWEQTTGHYQTVTSSDELCNKCHSDTEPHNNQITLENSIHSGFGCVSCHDPHSATASCSSCHADIRPESSIPPATPSGGVHPNNGAFCGGANCHPAATQAALSNFSIHGAVHASVSCVACHDASGMDVGPSEALGTWVTFKAMEADGTKTLEPQASHIIQASVDCNRCHFPENPWQLPLVTGNEFGK